MSEQDATGAGSPATIAVNHYSSDALPLGDRHDSWSRTAWPSVAVLFDSEPLEEFSTEAELVHLDQVILQFAHGTSRHFERSPARAGDDGIDVLGIGIQLDGGAVEGDAAGKSFVAAPGAMLFLDMTLPTSLTHPSGRAIQIALPRALAQHFLGSLPALHGTVVPPERAALLVSHLLQLRVALRGMAIDQQTLLMRTVLDLIAVALGRQAVIELPGEAPPALIGDRLLETARQEIELRLGLPSLRTSSLCERLGISRSKLFRLFEADGGVATYIMTRRLENVREALDRAESREQITELAYRFGFSDTSHLTKRFRQAYGVTPTAYRNRGRAVTIGS